MRLTLALAAVAGLGICMISATGSVRAQEADDATTEHTADGTAQFNLFALDGFGQTRTFTFDASYTERFGLPVPHPFRMSFPLNDALDFVADGAPDSGFAKFTWAAGEGDARSFVENLVIHSADWPQGDPAERTAAIQALIRDNVFARATASHGGGQLLGWGEGTINGLQVVQAAGTYTDAEWGPMLLRIVAYPNPGDGPSYFMLNNISLAMVPVVHLDQTRSTLGGQALLSFTYLPQE